MYTSTEASLQSLLSLMRSRPLAPREASLADEVSSEPLSAYVREVETRLRLPDYGRFELEAELLEENGFYDDILVALGGEAPEGVLIGADGGGAEALFMLVDDAAEGGYAIYRFAYDGQPYDNGKTLLKIGTFAALFAALAEEGDLDEEIAAL